MTGHLIKINTNDLTGYIKAPGGFSVNRAKLWTDAGRNMAGNLRSTYLGIFPKISLDFIAGLSESQVQLIAGLLDNPSFTVEWWDAVSQTYKTGTFYSGDFDIAVHLKTRGIYDSFKASLISFNKMT